MLPRLSRSLRFFAFSACLVAAASSFACSSDSGDDSEPSDTTGSGSGGKGGSTGSGNAAGEEGDGSGGDPGSSTGSGAEGGGDSSSGGSENSSGGRGGTSSTGGTDSGSGGDAGAPSSGGSGGTDPTGGTGGTETGPDLEAIARGQAIAEDIDVNCSACHGVNYAGSPLYDAGNITPDEATGIGSWSDAEIGTAITEGIGKDGEQLCSIMEPYDFDEGQVRDVIAFLRSLTPVSKAPTGTCVD